MTRRRRDHSQRASRLPVDSPVLVHRPRSHPPGTLHRDRLARVQQVRRVRDDVRRAGLRPVPVHGPASDDGDHARVVTARWRPRRVAARARAVARRTQRGRERERGAADDVPIHRTAAEQVPDADAIERGIESGPLVTQRNRAPSDVEQQLREFLATRRSATRETGDARDEHLATTAFDVDQPERAGRVGGEHESAAAAAANPRARSKTTGKRVPLRGSTSVESESGGGGDDLRHRERVMPQRRAKLGPVGGRLVVRSFRSFRRLVEGPDANDAVVSAGDQPTGRLRRPRDGAGVRALDREGGRVTRITVTAARKGLDHEVSVVATGDDARRRERAAADETRRRRRPRPSRTGRRRRWEPRRGERTTAARAPRPSVAERSDRHRRVARHLDLDVARSKDRYRRRRRLVNRLLVVVRGRGQPLLLLLLLLLLIVVVVLLFLFRRRRGSNPRRTNPQPSQPRARRVLLLGGVRRTLSRSPLASSGEFALRVVVPPPPRSAPRRFASRRVPRDEVALPLPLPAAGRGRAGRRRRRRRRRSECRFSARERDRDARARGVRRRAQGRRPIDVHGRERPRV